MKASTLQHVEELKVLIKSELSRRGGSVGAEASLNELAAASGVALPPHLAMYDTFSRLERAVSAAAMRHDVGNGIRGIRNRLRDLEKRQVISQELCHRFYVLREHRNRAVDGYSTPIALRDADAFISEVSTMVDEFDRC